jgi:transposase
MDKPIRGENLRKYIVTLSGDERAMLNDIVHCGPPQRYRVRRAWILLKLDSIPENKGWTRESIAKEHGVTRSTVLFIAKRFVENGFEAALERKEKKNRRGRKKDLERTAEILAIINSEPPENYERWTVRLVTEKYNSSCVVRKVTEKVVRLILTTNGVNLRMYRPVKLVGWRAKAVELIASAPPDGRPRWTCSLIAKELVRAGVVNHLTKNAVWIALKKMNISLE